MSNSKNITATEGRLTSGFSTMVTKVLSDQKIEEKIVKAVDSAKIRTGRVTKFYHYLDKAEVKLDQDKNQTVLCKVLHSYGGTLMDLYTPSADSRGFCNKLKEPYYKPRGTLHVAVLNIHDADSDEWLMLGYYNNEELVGLNPAKPGNIKLCARGGTNQYWVKFGFDGLDMRLPEKATTKVGKRNDNMGNVNYSNADDTYTKEEIDAIVASYETRIKTLETLIEELKPDNNE